VGPASRLSIRDDGYPRPPQNAGRSHQQSHFGVMQMKPAVVTSVGAGLRAGAWEINRPAKTPATESIARTRNDLSISLDQAQPQSVPPPIPERPLLPLPRAQEPEP